MSPEEMSSMMSLAAFCSAPAAPTSRWSRHYQRLCMRTKLIMLDISSGDIEGTCQIGFRDMEGQPTNQGPSGWWGLSTNKRRPRDRQNLYKPRLSHTVLIRRWFVGKKRWFVACKQTPSRPEILYDVQPYVFSEHLTERGTLQCRTFLGSYTRRP